MTTTHWHPWPDMTWPASQQEIWPFLRLLSGDRKPAPEVYVEDLVMPEDLEVYTKGGIVISGENCPEIALAALHLLSLRYGGDTVADNPHMSAEGLFAILNSAFIERRTPGVVLGLRRHAPRALQHLNSVPGLAQGYAFTLDGDDLYLGRVERHLPPRPPLTGDRDGILWHYPAPTPDNRDRPHPFTAIIDLVHAAVRHGRRVTQTEEHIVTCVQRMIDPYLYPQRLRLSPEEEYGLFTFGLWTILDHLNMFAVRPSQRLHYEPGLVRIVPTEIRDTAPRVIIDNTGVPTSQALFAVIHYARSRGFSVSSTWWYLMHRPNHATESGLSELAAQALEYLDEHTTTGTLFYDLDSSLSLILEDERTL